MPSATSPAQNLLPQAALLRLAISLSVQRGQLSITVKHLSGAQFHLDGAGGGSSFIGPEMCTEGRMPFPSLFALCMVPGPKMQACSSIFSHSIK